ncbi:MAG: helix-turn-helix transcriptional regulator [Pseudonocardia sp.]|nr:helix-turn-helix transcriptional regulator [Pseudonocardia sp.]
MADSATRRGRSRRPAAEVRAEVLAAAGELLLGDGMAAFTFERVAARSGASKVTLYRGWPSKGALALGAYFAAVEQRLEFPDTGDIEADQLWGAGYHPGRTPHGRVRRQPGPQRPGRDLYPMSGIPGL